MDSYLIIDGSFGSTGKGLISGYLANTRYPDTVVCQNGPNSGHTYVFDDGREVMVKTMPVGIVSPSVKNVLIGPGAIVDPDAFLKEVGKYADLLDGKRIMIHERAALVSPAHKEQEAKELTCISSTCQGTGAAAASKIMRDHDAICGSDRGRALLGGYIVDDEEYQRTIRSAHKLQIESAQGFELGVNTGFAFPFCTSRDVNVHAVLSDCAIPWGIRPEVIVSLRCHPIRVGNAYDEDGNQIGWSGPYYEDGKELSWEELGQAAETTTVTGKIRRVFEWSPTGFTRMYRFIKPDTIFLNFVNYLGDEEAVQKFIEDNIPMQHHDQLLGSGLILGNGPAHSDVMTYDRFMR